MSMNVLDFAAIDQTKLALVGGKGANLGELARIKGIAVPDGFCVTTEAYRTVVGDNEEFNKLLTLLAALKGDQPEEIAAVSGKIRSVIERIAIPSELAGEIFAHLARLGEEVPYAVRSSATAEDLPTASFAGQQDTYLNVIGREAILQGISKCWASLFTDRAVIYRLQNGFDHGKVLLSVVIQKMIFPEAAGIMFTADPLTANRKVLSIDAGFGLGEALVSGLVTADNYKVRDGKIVARQIAAKKLAIYGLPGGGTEEKELPPEQQTAQTLSDEQILRLAEAGRTVEAHFGKPQDIEWCLAADKFFLVQSRPITTLYPVPEESDGRNHVYMSFGHQQMMTDAMKPLGLAFFQLMGVEMKLIGGRLYGDIGPDMRSFVGRAIVRASMGKVDPLMDGAILNLMRRKDFMQNLSRGKRFLRMGQAYFSWKLPFVTLWIYLRNDPNVPAQLIKKNEASIKALQQKIDSLSGDALFDFIKTDYLDMLKFMYAPESMGSVFAGVLSVSWLNKRMKKWLGEQAVADVLSQSAPNNISSEMGRELLDVADVVRQYPAVMEYLARAEDATFFAGLVEVEGGAAAAQAIRGYLEKYGMRCAGEIDITRPRWHEQPTALVSMILGNIKNFAPGAHQAQLEQGLAEAEAKKQDLLARLRALPGGKGKAQKTAKNISRLRNFIGYREYPKYVMIWHDWLIKQALLREAAKLVRNGVLGAVEDVYYLTVDEFQAAVRLNKVDYEAIAKRQEEFKVFEKLTPPRIITSEGEIVSGAYDTAKLPPGALAGIPVSSGTVEGRARVILRLEDADLAEGDILVTAYTDPSWTPAFVSIKGLVAEVGGMMTHGAVVAREYGLPAVAGVENATKLIKDGQKIRVNGNEGYVEIL